MKSLMTKIIGACLGLSLATGVGVGIISNANEVTNPAYAAATTFTGSSSGGMTTTAGAQSGTKDDVTIAITNGVINGEQIRIYKNSTITISVPVNNYISQVVFTCTASGTDQYGPGCFASTSGYTYSGKTGTWTGSSQSISLKASSNQVRATSIAVTYEASSKTLESISLDGTLSKTSFVFGEAWSHEGLSVIGHYNDNSTAEITDDIHWSYNPGCTKIGTTSLTITAAVGDFTASYTHSVSVSKIASPFVNGVPYKMFIHNTNKNSDYYFIGSMNGYYGATTYDSTSTDIVNVYFEPKDDGQAIYFYASNNTSTAKQYIYISINDGHINFTFGTTVATWYYNGSTVVTYLASDDSIYGMGTYDNYVTFGAAASYRTSNYFAQFSLVNPLTAEDFANQFLDIVTCDSTGETAPTYKYNYSWQALNDLFDQLDATEQNTLKTVDISGTDVVAQAMARYNLIVAKYGYTNFVNRTISNVSNRIMNINGNGEVTNVVISMIAIVMSSVLAFYFFKKKKFER